MRMSRIKNEGEGWYHVVSRTAFQLFKFEDGDKSMFVNMMRRVALFSGVEVLNYCVMSNHFHILLHVPEPIEITDEILIERVAALYGSDYAKSLKARWKMLRKKKMTALVEKEQEMLKRRMGDMSEFMKTLKQRFSVWYRHKHLPGFTGTLWEGRYKSILVQGGIAALSAISAYIDLNPVRANMVDDPEKYRWCGYAAAMNGEAYAMRGIARIFKADATEKDFVKMAEEHYRVLLYETGSDALDEKSVREVLSNGGKLTMKQLLRCKVRHFISGVCIGDAKFVEEVFAKHREHFGENRKKGARRIRQSEEWQGVKLCTARRLVKMPISIA